MDWNLNDGNNQVLIRGSLEKASKMSDDDTVPGPSGVEAPSKSVRWDSPDSDSGSPEQDPKRALRKQSLVGTSGYVAQLLEGLEEEEARRGEEEERKPLRRQSVAERRDSMRAATEDMEQYMREALDSSRRDSSRRKSRSDSKVLPTLNSEDKMEKLQIVTAQAPVEDRPCSEWAPSHLLEAEMGVRTEISWLGTYVVGKDYWTERGSSEDQEEKVTYDKVEEKTAWYDMPIKKTEKGSIIQSMKHRFLDKFDVLKDEIDEEYEEKRKQRMISAAHAREAPASAAEEWSEDFRQSFRDVCRGGDQRSDRISMSDADRWLERAQLLDHARLTVIHTGFCFIASGGSRHLGLDFDKFTEFLQMISPATGLAVHDLARRMTACLRKAGG